MMRPFCGAIVVAMCLLLLAGAGCEGPGRAAAGRNGAVLNPVSGPDGEQGRGPAGAISDVPASGRGPAAPPAEARAAAWPFRPASLRIHPLSRAVSREGPATAIEARVEFFDRFGHTTKGVGMMRLELHAADAPPAGGRRLGAWEIDLSDVDTNLRHYDDVTRTYLFRLGLEGLGDLPATARLSATAVMPNQRLSASLTVALR